RCRSSARSRATGGSLILVVLQAQLRRDAVDRPRQPLPQRLGAAVSRRGDLGPVQALVAQLQELPLLAGQPPAHLLQEVPGRQQPARARLRRDKVPVAGAGLRRGEVLAAIDALLAGLV